MAIVSGIYAITNTVNGKQYVGQSANCALRWWRHKRDWREGSHCNAKLQRAFAKYGEDAFTFAVLEEVPDPAMLDAREQHYMDALRPAYNLLPTAGSSRGYKHPPESAQRHSAAQAKLMQDPEYAAKKRATIARAARSEKSRQATIARNRRPMSAETRAKIAASRRGTKLSPEHRAAIIAANTGRHPTPETRAKLTAAQLVRPRRTAETRAKMSKSQRDRMARGAARNAAGKFA